jgi:membrane protease YdiL (CAAX protease family)
MCIAILYQTENFSRIGLIGLGFFTPILVASAGFIRYVRCALTRVIPLDPDSFIHTVALVLVVALTLTSISPLIVLSEPPILTLAEILAAEGEDLFDGRSTEGQLLDDLYSLLWLVPAAIVAVGYAVRRDLKECLKRLGFTRPTRFQVISAVGAAFFFAFAATAVSHGIGWTWAKMGWAQTDMEAFYKFMAYALTPVGALVVSVVAGLGEELAVRGVLQPRLGIWLSNLFFTALHALQYNWDVLLVIFAGGLILGLIRKKTNTTTCVIIHGVYDFVLIMGIILEIPYMSL